MIMIDMEMPKYCRECQLMGDDHWCRFIGEYCDMRASWAAQCRPSDCPLSEQQEQNRWHSIAKEGNPKERGFYLWTSKDGTVREDLYRICDNTWTWCIAWRDGYDVVAWRPLPEPYQEEDNG